MGLTKKVPWINRGALYLQPPVFLDHSAELLGIGVPLDAAQEQGATK